VCVALNTHRLPVYLDNLAYCVLALRDKSKFHVNALLLHFPIESIVIIGLKNKKNIGTNPNKVQLFKLFKGKQWEGRQTLKPDTFKEHLQTLKG